MTNDARTLRTVLAAATFSAGFGFDHWLAMPAWSFWIGAITVALTVACKTDFLL